MAWRMAKAAAAVKVSGVTFGNRQTELEALARTEAASVTVELHRERENVYDSNATAVTLNGSKVGYLPVKAAALIAAIIDKGQTVKAALKGIYGGFCEGMNYGAQIFLTF